jgi:hypothetical protein
MPPDVIIVLVGMGIFALMFFGVIVVKLHGTSMSPFRVFHRLKIILRRFTPPGDGTILSGAVLSDAPLAIAAYAEIAGYPYSILANDDSTTMILVGLHKPVNTHIVAIGKSSGWAAGINKMRMQRYLEPVRLEGGYSEEIAMFCTKGKELELLQLFDPSDMAYFMDYCKAYNFEIYKDSIYISQTRGAKDAADDTPMIKDVKEFLVRNEKLLARI